MFPWKLIVLSGASGSGKTTCLKTLLRIRPDVRFVMLPSYTIRTPRPCDEPWYRYVTIEEFREIKANFEFAWIEWVHLTLYGTTKVDLVRSFACGDCVVTSLAPGDFRMIALSAMKYGVPTDRMLFLHIRSPHPEVRRQRLLLRGDDLEKIEQRIVECRNWNKIAASMRKAKRPEFLYPAIPVRYVKNTGTREEFEKSLQQIFKEGQ